MSDNRKAMVLASFIGDSLAMGAHWDYNPNNIIKTHGRVDRLLPAQAGGYHNGKLAGEFTHYGDQAMVLLESVAAKGRFDLDDFATRWRNLFANYSGYVDTATRETLAGFEAGQGSDTAGSESDELAGASRIAPLIYALVDQPEQLIQAARFQTAMTHRAILVGDAAEFWARATLACLDGLDPISALEKAAAEGSYSDSAVIDWVQDGLASRHTKSVRAIGNFARHCHVGAAFPGAIHLIAAYPDDLATALTECVMAGGDSATRNQVVGMVLGAHLGLEAIPGQWLEDLRQKEQIVALLESLE